MRNVHLSPQGAHPLSRSSVHWQQTLPQEVVLLLMHAGLHTKPQDAVVVVRGPEPLPRQSVDIPSANVHIGGRIL